MADNKPKDDDAFDDADFEDLDPVEDEDDLGDDDWNENASGSADATDRAATSGAAGQKTFVQKNFTLIVGAVVVVFGGVVAMALLGGHKPTVPLAPEEEASAETATPAPVETQGENTENNSQVVELSGQNNDMPPMPAPINGQPGEDADSTLTPLPSAQDMKDTKLPELAVDDVPAQPAAKATAQGEAPFDLAPNSNAGQPNAAAQLNNGMAEAAQTLPVPQSAPDTTPAIDTAAESAPAPAAAETVPVQPATVADLTPQLEQQKTQIDSLQSKLSDAQAQSKKDQDSLKAKDDQIDSLNRQIEDLQAKLATANEDTAEKPAAAKPKSPAPEEAGSTPAKQMKPAQPSTSKTATSWELKGLAGGKAVLGSTITGDVRQVAVGDKVEGLGRITSIGKEDGHWVVHGTNGQVSR